MRKALCWDLDGVVVQDRPLEEQGCHPDAIRLYAMLQAGHPLWQDCLAGRQDARTALLQLAAEHHVATDLCEHLWHIWMEGFDTDPRVIAQLHRCKQAGLYVVVASNQDKHRAQCLRTCADLAGLVDVWGFSCELGSAKPENVFYQKLQNLLPREIEQIAFIDDLRANLAGSESLGWRTHQYTGVTPLADFITDLLTPGGNNA